MVVGFLNLVVITLQGGLRFMCNESPKDTVFSFELSVFSECY